MKKLLTILLAMLCLMSICGCTKKDEGNIEIEEEPVQEISEGDKPEGLVGGWTVHNDDTIGYLPDEVKEAFEKATEGLTGVGYVPVAYLGSQVVAGVNYMILCKATTVTATPVTTLKFCTIYRDTEGNCKFNPMDDLDLGALQEQEESESKDGLAGGWTVAEDYRTVNLPAEAAKAFDEAFEGLVGATYEPMALLGTKVVNGIDYAILCHGTLTDKDATNTIAVAFIYSPIEGSAKLDKIIRLNLGDYNK